MAQLSRQEIQEIINRRMPGYEVIPEAETYMLDSTSRAVDASAPPINVVKRKFSQLAKEMNPQVHSTPDENVSTVRAMGKPDIDESEPSETGARVGDTVVMVRRRGFESDQGAGPKAIVLSSETGEIIGSQG